MKFFDARDRKCLIRLKTVCTPLKLLWLQLLEIFEKGSLMNQEEKKLGVVSLTALVTGNMIGSGIFLLPSAMARLGSLSLVSWIFTTIGSLFLAFVFSKMSTLIPKTGGPYAYAHAGLGKALGFQTAYCYWINAWVGNAAIALAGMGYL